MQLKLENRLTDISIRIGIVHASNIRMDAYPDNLQKELQEEIIKVSDGLDKQRELFRQACRDMLRNGSYKPTGRAKPSSEYLLREAGRDNFPSINSVVDINNLISLRYMVPISLWDPDRAGTDHVIFRLGEEGESFEFNESGQHIDLKDLVTGFRVTDEGELAMINPVKDAMATKTIDETRNVGVAVYYPIAAGSEKHLQQVLDDFAGWLQQAGTGVKTDTKVI